jgi:hypothetical protein
VLVVYTCINVGLRTRAWDPYPFILLNLFLSFSRPYAFCPEGLMRNRTAVQRPESQLFPLLSAGAARHRPDFAPSLP